MLVYLWKDSSEEIMVMYHLSNCFFHNIPLFSQIALVLVSCTCPGIPTSLPLLILLTLPLAVELLLYPQDPLRYHLSIKLLLSPLEVMILVSLLNKAFFPFHPLT